MGNGIFDSSVYEDFLGMRSSSNSPSPLQKDIKNGPMSNDSSHSLSSSKRSKDNLEHEELRCIIAIIRHGDRLVRPSS